MGLLRTDRDDGFHRDNPAATSSAASIAASARVKSAGSTSTSAAATAGTSTATAGRLLSSRQGLDARASSEASNSGFFDGPVTPGHLDPAADRQRRNAMRDSVHARQTDKAGASQLHHFVGGQILRNCNLVIRIRTGVDRYCCSNGGKGRENQPGDTPLRSSGDSIHCGVLFKMASSQLLCLLLLLLYQATLAVQQEPPCS
ncbi:hypothetical protein ACVKU6_000988 [Stenotrophomonas sp. PvP086]